MATIRIVYWISSLEENNNDNYMFGSFLFKPASSTVCSCSCVMTSQKLFRSFETMLQQLGMLRIYIKKKRARVREKKREKENNGGRVDKHKQHIYLIVSINYVCDCVYGEWERKRERPRGTNIFSDYQGARIEYVMCIGHCEPANIYYIQWIFRAILRSVLHRYAQRIQFTHTYR